MLLQISMGFPLSYFFIFLLVSLSSCNSVCAIKNINSLRTRLYNKNGDKSSIPLQLVALDLTSGITNTVVQDSAVALGSAGLAYGWLKIWIQLATKGVMSPLLSRKIIHCTSAPLFILTWPFYSSDSLICRLIASIVPLLQVIRLVYTGLNKASLSSDSEKATSESLAIAISRSGDKKEALQGPLIYAVGLLLSSVLFFRDSSLGIVAMSNMAAGDGLADIIGRKFGTAKWPGSKKSYLGSTAFVLGGFLMSSILISLMSVTGSMHIDLSTVLFIRLLSISLICGLVELIPYGDDNVSVQIVAMLLSWILIEPLKLV